MFLAMRLFSKSIDFWIFNFFERVESYLFSLLNRVFKLSFFVIFLFSGISTADILLYCSFTGDSMLLLLNSLRLNDCLISCFMKYFVLPLTSCICFGTASYPPFATWISFLIIRLFSNSIYASFSAFWKFVPL